MKNKERYELVIALVAIVISLSAFKSELVIIILDLGVFSFTLADYFLYLILVFIFALHLYAIPIMFSSTSYAHIKLFKYIEITSYVIFILAVISPSILLVAFALNYLVHIISIVPKETLSSITNVLQAILAILTALYTALKGYNIYTDKKKIALQEIEDNKIQELETARRLFEDGYYSQSILESYKIIENYFKKLLLEKQYISTHSKIYNVLIPAEKNGLLKKEQRDIIYKIKAMRNSAVHLNKEFTKKQAIEALSTVEELLKEK